MGIQTHLLKKIPIGLGSGKLGGVPSFVQRLHLDFYLLLAILICVTYGFFVLYSAGDESIDLVRRQIRNLLVAFLCLFIFAQIDVIYLKRFTLAAYVAVVALLGLTLVIGTEVNGAQRWLGIPGVLTFQPSEVMKIIMPSMVAVFLARKSLPPTLGTIAFCVLLIAIPCALIVVQPDLGTAIIVGMTGFFALFLAGLPYWILLSGFGLLLLIAPIAWNFLLLPYHKSRIMVLLNPDADPLGAGWNITQSITAIGSGGMWGKGWLQGPQSHLDFLPEQKTDFIFSVLAEEHGFIGVLALLCIYLCIILRGLYMAGSAQEPYARLLSGALICTLFVYVFVNIGMVSGILPVVGVPLPFISSGGTSLLSLMISMGIIMSIHTHKRMIDH